MACILCTYSPIAWHDLVSSGENINKKSICSALSVIAAYITFIFIIVSLKK